MDLTYALRLQKMIQCKTVSVKNNFDDTEFARLRHVMEELFPLVHKHAQRMIFSQDCWVYRLPGQDKNRNILLMSHHDVVEAGENWDHDPFGGEIRDDKLWGRGTVDTKTSLFAQFSALEELLSEGFALPCNVWLASSHNEEFGGDGIPTACAWFREQGITFEVVLDEGGAIIDPPLAGMKRKKCAMVAVHEKGRYKLLCTADAGSAHTGLTSAATMTPVERMSAFIQEISTAQPFIRRLNPQVKAMFRYMAPHCTFPMRFILGNVWLFGGMIRILLPKLSPQAGSLLGTTCAFYEVQGTGKCCSATAMLKGVDESDMLKDITAFGAVAEKYGISVRESEDSEYHGPADMTKPQFAYTMDCIRTLFPHYPPAPMILPAGTDARTLTDLCPCVLRFAPITLSKQQLNSVHSENENIDVKVIGEAVAFYKHFVRNYP